MKLHDILRVSVQDQAHRILTFQEIKKLVHARFPDLKPTSILPSEHSEPLRGNCQQCLQHPIFRKLGRGFYEVLVSSEPLAPDKSIHEKLAIALAQFPGQELGGAEMRQRVGELFPETHMASVIPSEHVRGGACKICIHEPLLERASVRGRYRVLAKPPVSGHLMVNERPTGDIGTQIADLLRRHGAEMLYHQPEFFLQRLAEQISGPRLFFNLLSLGIRERIPFDLLEFSDVVPEGVLFEKLSRRLSDNYGIVENLAHQSVRIWAQALALVPRSKRLQHPDVVASLFTDSIELGHGIDSPQLKNLTLSETATGYLVLKKGVRNVAMALRISASPETYVLGVKAGHVKRDGFERLLAYRTTDGTCPAELVSRFSPRGLDDWPHSTYIWFAGVPAQLLSQVMKMLDELF